MGVGVGVGVALNPDTTFARSLLFGGDRVKTNLKNVFCSRGAGGGGRRGGGGGGVVGGGLEALT